MRRIFFPLFVCLLAFSRLAAGAQALEVQGGASSLLGVEGLTLTHYAGDRTNVASVGVNRGGVLFGMATELRRADGITRYGDTAVQFTLPTDAQIGGRAVGARGLDWRQQSAHGELQFFAGKTGDSLGYGFVHGVDAARWMSAAVWSVRPDPRLTVWAVGAVGAAHAVLMAAEFRPTPRLVLAESAGWTGGHAVLAVSARMHGDSWNAHAEETHGVLALRPATAVGSAAAYVQSPEHEGFNFGFDKRVTRWMTVDAERVRYAGDAAAEIPDGAVLHEAGVTVHGDGMAAGLRGLEGHDGAYGNRGVSASFRVQRGPWTLDSVILASWSGHAGPTSSVLLSASREFDRLKVTAGADFAGGAPNLVAGAEVRGAWGSAGVSQRVVYVPFGPSAGFANVTAVSLRVHPHGVESSLETLAGRGVPLMSTAVAEKFFETGGALPDGARGGLRAAGHVGRFVVRGRVLDEEGRPVTAAAVRLDGAGMVWTDSSGVWEARRDRPEAVLVAASPADFLTAARYRAAEPVLEARAGEEGQGAEVVLHMVRCAGPCGIAPVEAIRAVDTAPALPGVEATDLVSLACAALPVAERFGRVVWRGDLR